MGESESAGRHPLMPSEILMYESRLCGFCRAAATLLERRGWPYRSLVVDGDRELRREMESRSGRRTVPQIYFGEHHVGGFDDLAELDGDGELDALYREHVLDAAGNDGAPADADRSR